MFAFEYQKKNYNYPKESAFDENGKNWILIIIMLEWLP